MKKMLLRLIICDILLLTLCGCKPDYNEENMVKNPKLFTTQIKNFLVMNTLDLATKQYIENEIKGDKNNILNCHDNTNNEAVCISYIFDLNHDKVPEIIFEKQFKVGESGGIALLAKLKNKWEYYPISGIFNSFGRLSQSRIALHQADVSAIKPKWNNIKTGKFILAAEYGGEPLPPIETFNLFERIFGVFPAAYLPKDIGRFSPTSLKLISENKKIPKEIYEQDFEFMAGSAPSCLQAKPTNVVCQSVLVDLNNDGNDEILYQDYDKNIYALYKSNKWGIMSYGSTVEINSNTYKEAQYINLSSISVEKPIWDDLLIGKYSFRPLQLPCSELGESYMCK